MKPLRSLLEEAKKYYETRYSRSPYLWEDEGIPFTISDYAGSISLDDFSEDDWKAAEEYGWSKEEVEELCENI